MSNTQKSVSEHRVFVLSALERIEVGEMTTNVLKDAPVDTHGLCQEIVYGVQRWKGSLDKMIQSNVKRKPKAWVRRLLYMALYELYFLEKPSHAVINEAVELCKQSKYKAQSSFVNAVLRQMTFPEGVYANENFPKWLFDLWAQNGRWLKSLQIPPKSGMIFGSQVIPDRYKDLVERPCKVENVEVNGAVYTNQKGPIANWVGYEDGEWWIMNPAAVHITDLAYNAVDKRDSITVLDMCAAPGGKTFRLKSYGASVTSMDISRTRLVRLKENARRLKMSINIVEQDATQYNSTLGLFDLVLLDAPCSGLGVIRKHPEVRWNRTIADVKSNVILQKALLQMACQYVKDGGVLAYCVCSLHPDEGKGVVQHFLHQNPNWTIIKTWTTSVDSKQIEHELLDGFQLYILQSTNEKHQ